jgi:hypothetical protein
MDAGARPGADLRARAKGQRPASARAAGGRLFLVGGLAYLPAVVEVDGANHLAVLALAAAMVTYLRERAEAQERLMRQFAAEAIDIAGRLVKIRHDGW